VERSFPPPSAPSGYTRRPDCLTLRKGGSAYSLYRDAIIASHRDGPIGRLPNSGVHAIRHRIVPDCSAWGRSPRGSSTLKLPLPRNPRMATRIHLPCWSIPDSRPASPRPIEIAQGKSRNGWEVAHRPPRWYRSLKIGESLKPPRGSKASRERRSARGDDPRLRPQTAMAECPPRDVFTAYYAGSRPPLPSLPGCAPG